MARQEPDPESAAAPRPTVEGPRPPAQSRRPLPERADRLPFWALLAVLVVAAVLRFSALGHEGLWCDEAYTALTVRLPLREMLSQLWHTDDAPPLFYLIEMLSTRLVGDSEAGLRFVSALAGMLAVALLLWPPQRGESDSESDPGSRHWSAALMAIAAYGVFQARQARSYALLLLLATLFVLSAKRLLFGRTKRRWLLPLSGALLCLTHHVGVILVLSSLLLWPLGPARRPRRRAWFLWHLPALLTWLVLWTGAGAQFRIHSKLNVWIAHHWQSHPLGLAPILSAALFAPGGLPPSQLSVPLATPLGLSLFWHILSSAFALFCLGAALPATTDRSPGRLESWWRVRISSEAAVEAGFFLVPLILLLLASWFATPVYVLGRTDVLAYPAFVLLVGRGLSRLSDSSRAIRIIGRTGFAYWVTLSLLSLAPSYGLAHPEAAKGTDRRLALELAAGGLREDDWLVHTFMTSPSIEYYLTRPHHRAWFPEEAGVNTASLYPTPDDSLRSYLKEAYILRRRLESALPEDGSAWIFGVIEPSSVAEVTQEGRRAVEIEQVAYPVSLLLYALVGRQPVTPAFFYRQDWVAGERLVIRVPRRTWIPVDSLPEVEFRLENP